MTIRRFLLDDDCRLGELLQAAVRREVPPMTAWERLMALSVALMLIIMLAVAWMSLDNIGAAGAWLGISIT